MKKNCIKVVGENTYVLNDNQKFIFDRNKAKEYFEKIQFPAIILDTEFFNHSHDRTNYEPKLYNEQNKDLVYVMQFSFAKSLKEVSVRDNKKAIKSLTIKRTFNDGTYNFYEQYEKTVKSFLNMCRNKEIRTIICAGGSNDIRIIKKWVNDNRSLFVRKQLNLVYYNNETKDLGINNFDIYDILENCFSFTNAKADGSEFWVKDNLPTAKASKDMVALTSMKKFYDYFSEIDDLPWKIEEEDIYQMCCKAYEFYAYKNGRNTNLDHHIRLNNTIKQVINHCYNDVLKMLDFIGFVYEFTFVKPEKNKFLKQEK